MSPPKIFISYSHDSQNHKGWVVSLATDLRKNGVEAVLDRWDLKPGQDIAMFMQRGIGEADRVLLICTEAYVNKAEAGQGGVGYERLIVTSEVVSSIDTTKFIPIIRDNTSTKKVPAFLGPRLYVDFTEDDKYEANLHELLRELLNAPASAKPTIGPNPFSGQVVAGTLSPRVVSITGATASNASLLDSPWFAREHAVASAGIGSLKLLGHMELRFGLHESIQKSQIELLNAIRSSEIRTFGWPLGITLENRDEYRPRPYGDGVRAEIAINSERLSYDYWAIAMNGDFYLLQSLFEDQRKKNEIFFNTRIVRITEALLFAANLYENLGAPKQTPLNIRVTHRGLNGRLLTSSSPNRALSSASTTRESESQVEIRTTLDELRPKLSSHVQKIASPLFMLFDFTTLADAIYADIVRRFAAGEVS